MGSLLGMWVCLFLPQYVLTSAQQGSHFVRCGVEGLGTELQRRGIARQAQWGARGIVSVFPVSEQYARADWLVTRNYLTSQLETRNQPAPLKRHIFSADVAVQTDSVVITSQQNFNGGFERTSLDACLERLNVQSVIKHRT